MVVPHVKQCLPGETRSPCPLRVMTTRWLLASRLFLKERRIATLHLLGRQLLDLAAIDIKVRFNETAM